MELWETIRLRCARDHEPIKTVARELGLAPNTVRKYLRSIDPPVRQPRARPHKLDPFVAQIDEPRRIPTAGDRGARRTRGPAVPAAARLGTRAAASAFECGYRKI